MKKLLHYIYNFVYLAFNWNPFLAIFVTWHEIKRGPKYGINTIKPEKLKGLTVAGGDISKSSPYEAVNYFILENLLENFRRLFPEESGLVDVGCGKGRVMVVAAYYGFTKITGIDFAKELCAEAEKNVKKTRTKFPGVRFKIVWNDILEFSLTGNEKVFFLFNPFNKEILKKFVENIEWSLKDFPRTIYFLYASPKYADVLFENGFKEVYRVNKMKPLEGLIAVKSDKSSGNN